MLAVGDSAHQTASEAVSMSVRIDLPLSAVFVTATRFAVVPPTDVDGGELPHLMHLATRWILATFVVGHYATLATKCL